MEPKFSTNFNLTLYQNGDRGDGSKVEAKMKPKCTFKKRILIFGESKNFYKFRNHKLFKLLIFKIKN